MTAGRGGLGPGAWALMALAAALVLVLATAAAPAGSAMMPTMMVGMALVSAAVLLGIVALVRVVSGWFGDAEVGDPIEIARRRYARGEIDREQFMRLRDDLASARPPRQE